MIRLLTLFGLALVTACASLSPPPPEVGTYERAGETWRAVGGTPVPALPRFAAGETFGTIEDIVTAAQVKSRLLTVDAKKEFRSVKITVTARGFSAPGLLAEQYDIKTTSDEDGFTIQTIYKTRQCGADGVDHTAWTTDLCPVPATGDENAAY